MSINGKQSVAELADWMKARDDANAHLAQGYADFAPTWVARDQAGFLDWTNDWHAFQARYQTAHDAAQKAIDLAKLDVVVPDTLIAAQAEWDGLLHALKASAPPDGGPVAKGDFDDLVARLNAAQTAAGAPVTAIAIAQPTGGLDADLNAMNSPVIQGGAAAGQAVIDAGKKIAGASESPWTWVGIAGAGLLALVLVARGR